MYWDKKNLKTLVEIELNKVKQSNTTGYTQYMNIYHSINLEHSLTHLTINT